MMELSAVLIQAVSPAPNPGDVGWAALLAINNGIFGAASLPLIIVMEAVVVWAMLPRQGIWRSVGRALAVSVAMNLVSAAVGLVSNSWWLGLVEPSTRSYPSEAHYIPPPGGQQLLWLKLTAVFWAVSVVIEGLVLMLAGRVAPKREGVWRAGRTWAAALAANTISYLAVFVVYPFLIKGALPTYL